jgi:hypothetical protein
MRPAFTLAVVVSWLVMVGLLVRKETAPPALSGAALPMHDVAEHDEWFTVLRDGRQVGHAHRVTSRTAGGQRFSEDLVLALAMLGVPQRIATGLEAETDARARSFASASRSSRRRPRSRPPARRTAAGSA